MSKLKSLLVGFWMFKNSVEKYKSVVTLWNRRETLKNKSLKPASTKVIKLDGLNLETSVSFDLISLSSKLI
jgi:hypothetical protein